MTKQTIKQLQGHINHLTEENRKLYNENRQLDQEVRRLNNTAKRQGIALAIIRGSLALSEDGDLY